MKNVYKLKGTPYVIDRDLPKEIVAARKRIWPKFKQAKAAQPQAKVSIQFPARLVVNGVTTMNEFPDWFEYMKGDRDTYLRHVRYKSTPTGAPHRTSTITFNRTSTRIVENPMGHPQDTQASVLISCSHIPLLVPPFLMFTLV